MTVRNLVKFEICQTSSLVSLNWHWLIWLDSAQLIPRFTLNLRWWVKKHQALMLYSHIIIYLWCICPISLWSRWQFSHCYTKFLYNFQTTVITKTFFHNSTKTNFIVHNFDDVQITISHTSHSTNDQCNACTLYRHTDNPDRTFYNFPLLFGPDNKGSMEFSIADRLQRFTWLLT